MSIIEQLANIRLSSTIITLHGYKSSRGEVADYQLAFHNSYRNALARSIAVLEQIKTVSDLQEKARTELLESYSFSLKNLDQEDKFYERVIHNGNEVKGLKRHKETGKLYLTGSLIRKTVLEPGVVYTPNKRELTIAKDELRKSLPTNKFRQFSLNKDSLESISVEGRTLFL